LLFEPGPNPKSNLTYFTNPTHRVTGSCVHQTDIPNVNITMRILKNIRYGHALEMLSCPSSSAAVSMFYQDR